MFGVVSEAKAIKRRIQTLAQLNLELAKLEGKRKATSMGVAGGLGVAAFVLVVYGIGWAIAISRPPHVAPGIKRWAKFAAFLGFTAMLAVTGRELLG